MGRNFKKQLTTKLNKMEKSNGLKKSETWNNVYEVLARLDLKETAGDCLDRPSAATEIEELFLKLLPIQNVSNQRELLIDFLDDVLMCQDEGASIVDREKYVDGYLGN